MGDPSNNPATNQELRASIVQQICEATFAEHPETTQFEPKSPSKSKGAQRRAATVLFLFCVFCSCWLAA